METFDKTSSRLRDPSTVPVMPTALRYGLIGGLVQVVLGLGFHLSGAMDYTQQGGTANNIATILNVLVTAAAVTLAIKKHRDEDLGGFISYGRSLGVGTLTGLVMGVVGAVWSYVFFSFVAPEVIGQIREMAMEKAMEGGQTEEQLEQAKGIMDFFTSPGFFAVIAIFFGVLIGFVASLIAGAILKRDPAPNV